jgi:hypothetical protein
MDPAVIAAEIATAKAAAANGEPSTLRPTAAEFSPAVNHIAVKLPDFWTKEPELWFMQAETTFQRANITCSLTKYDYVLQRLPMDMLVSVKEMARRVRAGEVDDPYEWLEAKLTASYQRSPWQLTFDLLDMPDLGDRRPSVLMDTMLVSFPDDCQPNRLFMVLFLSPLPPDICDQLIAKDLKEPAAMAAVAYRIYDARLQGGPVHAVQQVTASERAEVGRPPSPTVRRRQANCQANRWDRSRHGRSRRRNEGGDSNGLCFYHNKLVHS